MKLRYLTLAVLCAVALSVSAMAAEEGAAPGAGAKQAKAAAAKKAQAPAVALFDGKTTEGWQAVGKARWTVEDGILVGRQGPGAAPGDLLTMKDFDNFDLTVTYKAVWPANTGVWFRYQNPDLAYQADILEYKEPEAYSGTIYAPGVKELFLARNLDPKLEKKDDWNTMRIRAAGDRLQVWLNKTKVGDVRNDRSATGKIGFQVHPGDEFKSMAVMVKDIRLRPVKPGAQKQPLKAQQEAAK